MVAFTCVLYAFTVNCWTSELLSLMFLVIMLVVFLIYFKDFSVDAQ
jgi:hypothetical protein